MLTGNDYAQIRHAHRQGMSIRALARTFRRCRRSIRKALAEPEPTPYTLSQPRVAPKLGRFHGLIAQILADDEQAPPKQRHTAMQIHHRLIVEHGYTGSYDQVRRFVAGHRQRERATFIPLEHPAGERLEADFGHIHVDYPEGRRLVAVLLATWSYSHARFAIKLPSERVEAVLAGLMGRTVRGQRLTIGERFEQEKQAAMTLPVPSVRAVRLPERDGGHGPEIRPPSRHYKLSATS